jgi:hypothetical protein
MPIAKYVESRVWRRRDALMKLSWLWMVPQQRNETAGFALRRGFGRQRPGVSSGAQLVRPDIRQSSNFPDV